MQNRVLHIRTILIVVCLACSIIPINSSQALSKNSNLVVEILNSKHIYSSSDTVSITVRTTGQTINSQYEIEWILFEGYSQNGTFIDSGTISWTANTVVNQNEIDLSQFYSGELKYTLILMVFEDGVATDESEVKFIVFRDTIQEQIGEFIIFGDSLSDQGNSYASFGTPQSPPYYSGRFSNGPIWAEKVSSSYGKTITAGNGAGSGTNRAFGGAQTGNGMSFLILPNVGEQINRYLNNVNSNFNSDDLVFLFAGGNDFIFGAADPNITLQNVLNHANTIADSGAENFVVVNLPPIEKTPTYSSNTPTDIIQAGNKVNFYNSQLSIEMSALANQRNLSISVIDIHTMFNEIYYNGTFAGITNVVDEACGFNTGSCNSNDVVSNPDEFLFWDYVHPTRVIHDALAELMLQELGIQDTDGDSIGDTDDLCIWTPTDELANGDGCSPSQLDDDQDGVKNGNDLCPNTVINNTVDLNGCADYQKDTDNDGIYDDIDQCPDTSTGFLVDQQGCADYQKDSDSDSINDDIDMCPNTLFGYIVDQFGCADYQRDTDADTITDEADDCPGTLQIYAADENGCADYQKDTDEDSITDDMDKCPETALDLIVNTDGCAQYQLDTDSDSITNNIDICPQTEPNFQVDERGCADYEKDTDLDGINDDKDICPLTLEEYDVDLFGCADYQKDTDNDGFTDDLDACPMTIGSKEGCPLISITTYLPEDQTIVLKSSTVEYRFYVSCESGCAMDVYAYPSFLADTELEPYLIKGDMVNETIEFEMEFSQYNVQTLNLEIFAKSGLAKTKVENTVYFVDKLVEIPEDVPEEDEDDGLGGVFESGKEFVADSDAVVVLLNVGLILAIIFVLVLLVRTPKNDVVIRNESEMLKTSNFEIDDSQSLFNEENIEFEDSSNTLVDFPPNEFHHIEQQSKNELDIDWIEELID